MFKLSPSSLGLLAALGFSSLVHGDTRNWNPSGQGCVDPSGYLSCYKAQSDQAVSCVDLCTSSEPAGSEELTLCEAGCGGAWLAGNIGCWIQGCWNQVYSCEYQLTALSYFDGTDLVQNNNIPFYPPPDDASAGACSCNLGYAYGNQTYVNPSLACIDAASTGNVDLVDQCDCCMNSVEASNILNVCPNSDLSVIGFPAWLTQYQSLLSQYTTDNCAILDDSPDTCISTYSQPFHGTTVYNPLNLPTGVPGTEPLSNTAGNAFTDFGASVFTLSLFPGYSSVITPAAFDGRAAANTGSVDATGTNVVSVNPTVTPAGTGGSNTASTTGNSATTGTAATGSAASASATKKSDAGKALEMRISLPLLGIFAALFFL